MGVGGVFTSKDRTSRTVRTVFAALLGFGLLVSLSVCVPDTDPPTEAPETSAVAPDTTDRPSPDESATGGAIVKKRSDAGRVSAVRTVSALVVRIVDGDTIEVRLGDGRSEKVRLIGVDTPENTTKVEPYGAEATAFTARSLKGKTVHLERDAEQYDHYRRTLAYVWLEPPASVSDAEIRAKLFNARLLLEGYANLMTIPPNVKYVDFLKTFQAEARAGDKGLWALPVMPRAPSAKSGPSSEGGGAFKDYGKPVGEYVGNSNSHKFHYTSCRYASKISPSHRVPFASRDAAIAARYAPCKVCDP